MDQLYPLKFKPILKERIWGGDKLKTQFGKQGTCHRCGESWEISAVQGDISVVDHGFLKGNSLQELIEIYMGDLVGEKVYEQFGIEFPLLIKFIDATDDLSIQVHPGDKMARERHNSYGKTEMWYVIDADPGSELISGFNGPMTKEAYLEHLRDGTLRQVMNRVSVQAGDVFFIPAGRVHAIGAGILLAEIQQTSDITYRIYDWDRVDASGKPRELHTELALDAIDYSFVKEVKNVAADAPDEFVNLAGCRYFTTNRLIFGRPVEKDYFEMDTFVIYLCIEGIFSLETNQNDRIEIKKGETVLLPASIAQVRLVPQGKAELLEVYIE